MSTPAAAPATKAERSQAEIEKHNGKCVSGSCKCEAFELVAVRDGFPTCICTHTRWAHSRIAP